MVKGITVNAMDNYLESFSAINPLSQTASHSRKSVAKAPAGEKNLAGLKPGHVALWQPSQFTDQQSCSQSTLDALASMATFQLLAPSETDTLKSKVSQPLDSNQSEASLAANTVPASFTHALETSELVSSGFRSLFDAYSRKQLPEVLLIECNTECFPAYWLALARYALLLDQLGFSLETPQGYMEGEQWSRLLWPKLVLVGTGLQARLFERGLFEQFKRLTHLKPVQKKLERLCQQNIFRLLPTVCKGKQAKGGKSSIISAAVLAGETQAGTRYVQGLLETLLSLPTKQAALETYCVGAIPAQRLEWHSLWQNNVLQKKMKKLSKAEKTALETSALQMANKLGLFYSGEPASLHEPSLAGQVVAWPKQELAMAFTLLHGYAKHLGLLTCVDAQQAWQNLSASISSECS